MIKKYFKKEITIPKSDSQKFHEDYEKYLKIQEMFERGGGK